MRPPRWIASALAGIVAVATLTGIGYMGVKATDTSAQAQKNEAAAIASLRSKDGQIDSLRAELEQVLAAPTPVAREVIVNRYTPVPVPTVSRPVAATPRPAPTTTTTQPPSTTTTTRPSPHPCTTLPVVGTCVP